jgi:aspartate/methionine/tyrosine aminotransferase
MSARAMGPRTAEPAARLDAVQTPVIPVMGELIRQTPGCLSLGQGMVHWGPPRAALEAVHTALAQEQDLNPYGAVAGEPELHEALVQWLRRHHQINLDDSSLLITAGSNMAFNAIVQVLCDPGDELILPIPWYFNHEMAIRLAGGRPVGVQAGLIPDPERLAAAITARTRAIVTVSPNNPSGAVWPPEVLAAINRLCAKHGLLHISDEAYGLFGHGTTPVHSPGSAAGSGEHTITLGSLSKSHGMAGWRLGWAVVPRALQADLAKVQDTILICPPRLIQRAAIGALSVGAGWCQERMVNLAARRLRVLAALNQADGPWRVLGPADGAFYVLLELQSACSSDQAMERLIRQHGVALVSGRSFGLDGCCLRLSYGMLGDDDLDEALRRLRRGLREIAADQRVG